MAHREQELPMTDDSNFLGITEEELTCPAIFGPAEA